MRINRFTSILLLLFALSGCVHHTSTKEPFHVEGFVVVRGDEPFTRLVLETEMRNSYVLLLPAAERTRLQREAPAVIRAYGTLEMREWNGRNRVHLLVERWQAASDSSAAQ